MVFLKTIALAYKERRSEKIIFELNLEKQVECRYTEIVFVCLGCVARAAGRENEKNNTRNVSIFLVYIMASASPIQWEEKWPLRQLLPGSLQSGKPHPGKRPADEVTSPKPSAG